MIDLRVIPLCLSALLALSACKPVVEFFAFHPDRTYAVPAESLPAGTEDLFLETEDGVRIQALHLRHPSSKILTIYFHGNAGNVYHRLPDLQRLRSFGSSVLAVGYRGYGKSEGSPSEPGIYGDARAAFAYATGPLGYPPSRIVLLGRSIGSTAATDLAQGKDLGGLILVSPLTSGREQASAMGMGFAAPIAGDAFDNLRKIGNVAAPLLVVHGTADHIIPVAMGKKIAAAAPGAVELHLIEGAGHNDLSSRHAARYWKPIAAFLARVAATR